MTRQDLEQLYDINDVQSEDALSKSLREFGEELESDGENKR